MGRWPCPLGGLWVARAGGRVSRLRLARQAGMSDQRLRELERAAATGDIEAGLRLLVERRRAGSKPRELHARPLDRSPLEVSADWAGVGGGGEGRRCFECGARLGLGEVPDWWAGAPCCPRPAIPGAEGCVDGARAREAFWAGVDADLLVP